MSTNINRDWTWFSLFGPKNTNGIPHMEGDTPEDYEVDEEYFETEIIDIEENEDDEYEDEVTEGIPVDYDDDEED
jgi:hypothetical protein